MYNVHEVVYYYVQCTRGCILSCTMYTRLYIIMYNVHEVVYYYVQCTRGCILLCTMYTRLYIIMYNVQEVVYYYVQCTRGCILSCTMYTRLYIIMHNVHEVVYCYLYENVVVSVKCHQFYLSVANSMKYIHVHVYLCTAVCTCRGVQCTHVLNLGMVKYIIYIYMYMRLCTYIVSVLPFTKTKLFYIYMKYICVSSCIINMACVSLYIIIHIRSCTYMYMYIGVLPFKTVFCTFCTQTITNTDYIPLLSFIHYLYIYIYMYM